MVNVNGYLVGFLVLASAVVFADAKPVPPKDVAKKVAVVKKDKVPVDKELTTQEFAQVDSWVAAKVKSGAMTKEQGANAMKHAAALKKVMDSEKPKKGAK